MKIKSLLAAVLFATTAIATVPAVAAPVAYKLDPAHTSVAFIVNHVGFSNAIGRFNTVSGDVAFDQDALANNKVTVVIDTASFDTNHAKRDEHLRSPDFFNVKEFPKMTFTSTRIEQTDDKTGKLYGDLTLLGVTRPVVLDVTFNKSGVSPASKLETVGFSARGTVKRTDFGMKYGAPAIGENIQLLIEAEAVKS
jgi:polyisoprenoid-binding protein YceI